MNRRQKKKIILMFVLFLAVLSGKVFAEDADLEKIVVTPYRYGESLTKTASSVTVITQRDIKNSNAKKVVDVFRSIPGVTVKDYYGNGAQATVDMSGFGEQAALNVLVLVDGRRVNDIDLSGVDWSQVPLDQVERIEVIRGGTGGVLYGDNASSGVINIITKKGYGSPKINLQTQYGSYDMNAQKLSWGGGIDDKTSYRVYGGRESTHGYRKNSFNKSDNFASKLEHKLNDSVTLHFDSGFYTSSYGLPGALFQSDIDQYSRRHAKYADDHANKKDYYFLTGAKIDALDFGDFDIDFSFRHKNNDSYYLTSYALYPTYGGVQNDVIKTFGMMPKYTLDKSILNHDNKFIAGFDYYRSDYSSDSYALSNNSKVNFTDVRKNSISTYLQDELSILKELVLVGGYRYETVRYVFGYHDNLGFNPDQDTKLHPNEWAFNTGLSYKYQDDSSLFLNAGRSYRFPEIDEFNFFDSFGARQLNTDLRPQSAINYQVGVRHELSDSLKGSFSLFRMNVKDELYFNSTGGPSGFGQNENYDKTIHEGIESSMDEKLNNWITLFENYTFTNAYFDGGVYDKNKIPLVPQHKGGIGLRLSLPKNITLNLMGNYVGKQYALNDQANAYSRLKGYMTADTNLSWRHKDLTVTLGVNNLLDKKYSEYAGVRVSDGANFYYPSPERNFSLKVDYSF